MCLDLERRVTARTSTAFASVVVGMWLGIVSVVYTDWFGFAVGLVAFTFGVYELRPPRA